jgi:hypothetical protein
MLSFEWDLQSLWKLVWNVFQIAADALTFLRLCLCSPASVAAENLFLRKQLALYVERQKNLGVRQIRSALLSANSADSLTGVML